MYMHIYVKQYQQQKQQLTATNNAHNAKSFI